MLHFPGYVPTPIFAHAMYMTPLEEHGCQAERIVHSSRVDSNSEGQAVIPLVGGWANWSTRKARRLGPVQDARSHWDWGSIWKILALETPVLKHHTQGPVVPMEGRLPGLISLGPEVDQELIYRWVPAEWQDMSEDWYSGWEHPACGLKNCSDGYIQGSQELDRRDSWPNLQQCPLNSVLPNSVDTVIMGLWVG